MMILLIHLTGTIFTLKTVCHGLIPKSQNVKVITIEPFEKVKSTFGLRMVYVTFNRFDFR
jgi:hypothetical protein